MNESCRMCKSRGSEDPYYLAHMRGDISCHIHTSNTWGDSMIVCSCFSANFDGFLQWNTPLTALVRPWKKRVCYYKNVLLTSVQSENFCANYYVIRMLGWYCSDSSASLFQEHNFTLSSSTTFTQCPPNPSIQWMFSVVFTSFYLEFEIRPQPAERSCSLPRLHGIFHICNRLSLFACSKRCPEQSADTAQRCFALLVCIEKIFCVFIYFLYTCKVVLPCEWSWSLEWLSQ